MRHLRLLLLSLLTAIGDAAATSDLNNVWLLLQQGRFSEVIAGAEAIMSKDRDALPAYDLVALVHVDTGKLNEGEAYFRRRATSDSGPGPHYGLALMLERKQEDRSARKEFEACVRLAPASSSFGCFEGLGRTSSSERALAEGLRPTASPVGALLARASFFLRMRRLQDGMLSVRKGLELSRESGLRELELTFRELLASFYLARNRDYAEAIEDLELAYAGWLAVDDWRGQVRVATQFLGIALQTKDRELGQHWFDVLQNHLRKHPAKKTEAILAGYVSRSRMDDGDLRGALRSLLDEKVLLESAGARIDQLLVIIGALYDRLGEFASAEDSLQLAYMTSPGPVDRAYVLRSLGVIYGNHGDYTRALEYGGRSVVLFRSVRMPLQAGAGQRNLAEIYSDLNDYVAAEGLLRKALASARAHSDAGEEQGSLTDLGALLLKMGKPSQALKYLNSALSLAGHTSYTTARIEALLGVSNAYLRLEKPALALTFVDQAAAGARSIESRDLEARAGLEVAAIQQRLGHVDLAAKRLRDALAIAETYNLPDAYLRARLELAEISLRNLKYAEAVAHLEPAANRLDAVRTSTPGPNLRAGLLSGNWRIYEDLIYALSEMGEEKRAFDISERGRARALLDEVAKTGAPQPRQAELTPLSMIEYQMRSDDTVLLSYVLGERRSYLWVITGQGTQMVPLPPRSQIESDIEAYRRVLASPPKRPSDQNLELGRRLYDVLCGPVDSLLRRSHKVVVIPDGRLYYLPFETLVRKDGDFLVQNLTLSYAPSASVLMNLRRKQPVEPGLGFLGYGPPDFQNLTARVYGLTRSVYTRAGFNLSPLPHAREELLNIAALFPQGSAKIQWGSEATRAAVLNAKSADYYILHFATHTILDDQVPGRSGIVLSPAKDGSDDGILRAADILNLHLDAGLVVLSACQTGFGKLLRGEGVVGLSNAFLRAGAARVVVSEWAVNDLATADFMAAFYRGIIKRQSPAEALRQAKLEMITSASLGYRHPYFWAPFVLIGNF